MSRTGRTLLAASAGLDRACLALAKAALVGMVLVIMLQVVARYGLRSPPGWTEELARYLMVWGGLLGATAAFRRAADPAVVKLDETGGSVRALAGKAVLALTVIVFLAPILYFSFFGQNMDPGRSFLARNLARTSPALGINLIWIAAAIPTFCIILVVHLAARIAGGPLRQTPPPGATPEPEAASP